MLRRWSWCGRDKNDNELSLNIYTQRGLTGLAGGNSPRWLAEKMSKFEFGLAGKTWKDVSTKRKGTTEEVINRAQETLEIRDYNSWRLPNSIGGCGPGPWTNDQVLERALGPTRGYLKHHTFEAFPDGIYVEDRGLKKKEVIDIHRFA